MSRIFRTRAFTLIELLVVIVIIAILMAIAIPAYLSQQQKAQDAKAKQYLNYAYRDLRASATENNDLYPVTPATQLSAIQQSNPQLQVASGNCLTSLGALASNTVMVDSGTTANSLTLCARSQSGNIWKLLASASGAQQMVDGTLIPLTFGTSPITDISRVANTQGDGRAPPDSSTGIWEASTNYLPNGGFETNAASWSVMGAGVTTRDTTTAKFGTASGHITYGGGANFQGRYIDTVGLPAGNLTLSFWMKGTGTITVRFGLGASGNLFDIPIQPTWTKYTLTSTTTGDARAEFSSGFNTFSYDAYIDGVQIEPKAIATPYIETSAGVASRVMATPSFSSAPLSYDQGWIALRLRMGWGSTATIPFAPRPFDWRSCPSSCFIRGLAWDSVTSKWQWAGYGDVGPVVSFNAGDHVTLIAKWVTAGPNVTFSTSQNGAAFAGTTGASAGPITGTLWIGSAGGSPINSDVFWMASGTGTLSDTDASSINSLGDGDPKLSSFPGASSPTMTWDGTSANASLK
jgi:type IV pilus assembly protein PilA